jgi:CRISPR-associated endonuclease/helicase Cas3
MENWRLFWAKTNREKIKGLPDDWTHPLWAHLIDVGSAAQVLWEEFLPPKLKQTIAQGVCMQEEEAGQFLSIWIGLHDLGKGIPGFQEMHEPTKTLLIGKGLVFHDRPNRLHHGHASIAIAHCWLNRNQFQADTLLHALAAFVGIHHGKLCHSDVWNDVLQSSKPEAVLGNAGWREAQYELTEAVLRAWGVPLPAVTHFPTLNPFTSPWPDWLMAFAGWATLADWLGSMQRCYDSTVKAEDDLREYMIRSRSGAQQAYQQAGLYQQAKLQNAPFIQHFGNKPRPLQDIAIHLPLSADQPNLMIVEAPTGEGKTEAAFYLCARLRGGMYVAMPSQSTSDGLFPRLKRFLAGDDKKGLVAAHQGDTAVLRLVHGNDLLHEDALSLLAVATSMAEIDDDDQDGASRVGISAQDRVLSWFLPQKRALLVPYGVGTVDQLFLGVLYAKHFFLRLFALSGKTVIFDEVHAYDAYMNSLFDVLLQWLKAFHIHVVVLSATLPTDTRRRMLQAWGCPDREINSDPAPYPVVWHATDGTPAMVPFHPASDRQGQHLRFQWCEADVDSIAAKARQLLSQGATVMVVCNTVPRAQAVFKQLDFDAVLPEDDRMLLHARMPQSWRKEREKAALVRFGADRPNRPGLLVGTQVIEQSLDLDVDVLITDLAPIDLLLQRAGRLHRHQHQRPDGFAQPSLYIACAEAETGQLPDVVELSGGGHIYATALLWKTWTILQQAGGWSLPLGNPIGPGYRSLIEAVYGDILTLWEGVNEQTQITYQAEVTKWLRQDKEQMAEAAKRLVPSPGKIRQLFALPKPELSEEEEHQGMMPTYLRAATRNPDSIQAEVLLLYRTEEGWGVEQEGPTVLRRPVHGVISPETLRTLFGASLRISQVGLVAELWKQEDAAWKALQEEHKVLKRFHLIELKKGEATLGKYTLRLNNRLGLVDEKPSP